MFYLKERSHVLIVLRKTLILFSRDPRRKIWKSKKERKRIKKAQGLAKSKPKSHERKKRQRISVFLQNDTQARVICRRSKETFKTEPAKRMLAHSAQHMDKFTFTERTILNPRNTDYATAYAKLERKLARRDVEIGNTFLLHCASLQIYLTFATRSIANKEATEKKTGWHESLSAFKLLIRLKGVRIAKKETVESFVRVSAETQYGFWRATDTPTTFSMRGERRMSERRGWRSFCVRKRDLSGKGPFIKVRASGRERGRTRENAREGKISYDILDVDYPRWEGTLKDETHATSENKASSEFFSRRKFQS